MLIVSNGIPKNSKLNPSGTPVTIPSSETESCGTMIRGISSGTMLGCEIAYPPTALELENAAEDGGENVRRDARWSSQEGP